MEILEKIRSLPESKRLMLAYVTMAIFCLVIAGSWFFLFASDIPKIAGPDGQAKETERTEQKDIPSPAAGLIESLKGVGSLFTPKQ